MVKETSKKKSKKTIEMDTAILKEIKKTKYEDPMVEATKTIKKSLDSYMNVDYSSKYRKQVLILNYLRTGQVKEMKEKQEAWDLIYDYIKTHHKAVQEYEMALRLKEKKESKKHGN